MNIEDAKKLLSEVTPGLWRVKDTSIEVEFKDGTRIAVAEIKQMHGWRPVWESKANGELFAKARATLDVVIVAIRAHQDQEAVDQHFAKCSYELSGLDNCETASEDDGQPLFCKDYRRLAEVAAAKRCEAFATWEEL